LLAWTVTTPFVVESHDFPWCTTTNSTATWGFAMMLGFLAISACFFSLNYLRQSRDIPPFFLDGGRLTLSVICWLMIVIVVIFAFAFTKAHLDPPTIVNLVCIPCIVNLFLIVVLFIRKLWNVQSSTNVHLSGFSYAGRPAKTNNSHQDASDGTDLKNTEKDLVYFKGELEKVVSDINYHEVKLDERNKAAAAIRRDMMLCNNKRAWINHLQGRVAEGFSSHDLHDHSHFKPKLNTHQEDDKLSTGDSLNPGPPSTSGSPSNSGPVSVTPT